MKDPNIKIIPFIWPILKNYHRVIMVYTYVKQKNVTCGMVDLSSRVIGSGAITNSKKLNVSLRVGIDSIVESKLKK